VLGVRAPADGHLAAIADQVVDTTVIPDCEKLADDVFGGHRPTLTSRDLEN
jgi:hypothetical protein